SDPRSQGPWSTRARVLQIDDVAERCCRKLDCPDPVCMTEIPPERALRALRELEQQTMSGRD
ncbi:MAG: hypothetical protein RRA94_11660, partial [Bacteroidota bacterium]|nr:hypothetical protein [Bacteroidota bacterium]